MSRVLGCRVLRNQVQAASSRWKALLLGGIALVALSGAGQAEEYRLGPEDVLAVGVLRHPEWSVNQVTVTSAGKINLPVVGELVASGKTIAQLDAIITQRLSGRIRFPEVTVSLVTPRQTQVFVVGSVAKPGAYPIKPGWRVSDALAVAGGTTVRPEVIAASLSRANQKKPVPLDLAKILSDSNNPANLTLQSGDTVRFSARTIQVQVVGEVGKSGPYEVPLGDGVVEAVALAGGPAPTAALSKTIVQRADGSRVAVDLYKALVLNQEGNNLKLKAGDMVMIPQSNARVTVLGAVKSPGFFDIKDGGTLRAAEAVALAGGALPTAALTKATVIREDKTEVPVNLYQVMVKGQQESDLLLQAGDLVMVPETKARVTVLGAVKSPGAYPIPDGNTLRVSDVLALAGGLAISPTEEGRINITRVASATAASGAPAVSSVPVTGESTAMGQPRTWSIDPAALVNDSDMSENALVQDGDLINVTAAPKIWTVYVSGEVKNEGGYEVTQGDSIPGLLSKAGGPKETAALKNIKVQRAGGKTYDIDAYSAVKRGETLDFKLQAGDYVVVPKNTRQVLVMPAVNVPGYKPMPEEGVMTVADALTAAGGSRQGARLFEVAVLRQTPSGAMEKHVINLDKVYKNGASLETSLNQPLQPGDVVYVPDGKSGSTLLQRFTGFVPFVRMFGF
jgi:polysaccharide biosynthesis/export protein